MFSTAEYFMENSSDISKIDTAIDQLESNILTLKHGGMISDIDLKPLPSEFFKDWDNIYQKWILLKTTLTNNILKQNQIISPIVTSEAATTSTTGSATPGTAFSTSGPATSERITTPTGSRKTSKRG
jgi:hypothetical protein